MKYGCSIKERQTKKGIVYDARWWYYDADGVKRLGGAYGKPTKRQANDAYLAFVKQYAPPTTRAKETTALVFDAVLEQYFTQILTENTEATVYEKRKQFARYITPYFSGRDIRKITVEDLYRWQDELWAMKNNRTGQPYTFKYKDKIRSFLYSFLQWSAVRYRTENNLKFVQKPRKITPPREMSIWEETDFLCFLGKIDDEVWRMFFSLLFYTGVRVGEAIALTDDKIGDGRIVVNASVTRKTLDDSPWKIKCTKNRKNRTNKLVSIVDKQVASFKEFKKKQGVKGNFFLYGTRPLAEQSYQRALARYCALAGMEKIRIHDFRHSYVSMLINFGASPALVADLIGDTLEQVLKTYGHLWKSERDRVVELMEIKCKKVR